MAAPPVPGVLDGSSCDPGTAPGLRAERAGQHWRSLPISAEAFGPATLTINRTTTLQNTVRVDAGINLQAVSLAAGFDTSRAEAVAVEGSFEAPAEPRGAKWVLTTNVREQDYLVYQCRPTPRGGAFARVGHVAQVLDQFEFPHYMVPPAPHTVG